MISNYILCILGGALVGFVLGGLAMHQDMARNQSKIKK